MIKQLVAGMIAITLLVVPSVCSAGNIFHDIQDNVGTDRFAHAAVSYVICDQLHRNCKMNKFWAAFTTIAIGAAKEKFVDSEWDRGDFAADCAGVLMYQVEF